jgi:hypothetical protein
MSGPEKVPSPVQSSELVESPQSISQLSPPIVFVDEELDSIMQVCPEDFHTMRYSPHSRTPSPDMPPAGSSPVGISVCLSNVSGYNRHINDLLQSIVTSEELAVSYGAGAGPYNAGAAGSACGPQPPGAGPCNTVATPLMASESRDFIPDAEPAYVILIDKETTPSKCFRCG